MFRTGVRRRPMPSPEDTFAKWLSMAIELSRCCPKSDRSFAVGAVVVDSADRLLTTGYSLELGLGWHAEEVALHKASEDGLDLRGCTLFSSLEPCSVRLSGNRRSSSAARVGPSWKRAASRSSTCPSLARPSVQSTPTCSRGTANGPSR